MESVQRLDYFDFLRALAIISVVLLHSAAPLLYEFNYISIIDWQIANIYDSLTRWCVPIFLMVSGYLNINSPHRTTIFYKKRFTKIIIPFVFWGIFYYLFSLYLNPNIYLFPALLDLHTYTIFLKQLVFGPVYYHLWFLYSIIILYLLNPMLKELLNRISTRTLSYFVIIYFFLISGNNILNSLFDIGINTSGLANSVGYFTYGFLFIGYYLLGYLLGQVEKIDKVILNFVGVLSIVITIAGTYVITLKNDGIFNAFFYHYLNFNTVFVSVWVFLLLKIKNPKKNKLISNISKYSFGIYLVHVFVIDLLNKYDFSISVINPILGIPFFSVIVLLVSYIIVRILNRLPIINALVP